MIPVGSLTVYPTILDLRGSKVTLTWSSPYATSAILDNGLGTMVNPTKGSITTFVLSATTFNMTFVNSEGTVVASADVEVLPDEIVTSYDGATISRVFRELGAGLVATNQTRPLGDGFPSYQIKAKQPIGETAEQVITSDLEDVVTSDGQEVWVKI